MPRGFCPLPHAIPSRPRCAWAVSPRCCWPGSFLSLCTARTLSGRPLHKPRRSSRANRWFVRLYISFRLARILIAKPVPFLRGYALSRAQKIVPDRLVAQRGNKGPVREAVVLGNPWRQRHLTLPPRHLTVTCDADIAGFGGQDQLRLPRPDQVDIDFGQKLGVEQGAVLGAAGIVDRIARAEIIETG